MSLTSLQKIKINIPLNYHSSVVEIVQKREDSTLEIAACWRASDKGQAVHLEFLEAFASLTGIDLKSMIREKDKQHGSDLEVIFLAKDEQQMEEILFAIDAVNTLSLGGLTNPFEALSLIFIERDEECGIKYQGDVEESINQAKDSLLERLLTCFPLTGKMSSFVTPSLLHYYFKTHPVSPEIIQKICRELTGEEDQSASGALFYSTVLNVLSAEKREEIIEDNLSNLQSLTLNDLINVQGANALSRLVDTDVDKAVAYFSKHPSFAIALSRISPSPSQMKERGIILALQRKVNRPQA